MSSARVPLLWLLLGLLLAGSAEGRKLPKAKYLFDLSVLNPEVRASLEEIKVLLLHEENLDLVWKLERKPELADVVLVTCSPACHSSDVLEALANWAKAGGGGLFLGPSALFQASRFLLPEEIFIDPDSMEIPSGHSWLAQDSPLTENVQQVHHELWCSRNGTGSLRLHLRGAPAAALRVAGEPEELPEDEWQIEWQTDGGPDEGTVGEWPEEPPPADPSPADPEEELAVELLTGPEDMLQPVLTWGRFPDRGARTALAASRPILLATSYQGARAVWYAYDLETRKPCRPLYDDVRLWSNLMHWLAGR